MKIEYDCKLCGCRCIKQLRTFSLERGLICKKSHKPNKYDKVSFTCEVCGKTSSIRRELFDKRSYKLCKACQANQNAGGKEAKRLEYLERAKKSKNTQIEKYGGVGNANPSANKKRLDTIKLKYGESYYSDMFKKFYSNRTKEEIEASNEKRKSTNLKKYGKSSPGFRHAYYKVGDVFLDSKYEFYFYVYCIDNDISIEREPIGIDYVDSVGNLHTYYPDFRTPEGLIETKSDYYLSKTSVEKLKVMEDNNVIIINNSKIQFYKNYVIQKYGSKYHLFFKTL